MRLDSAEDSHIAFEMNDLLLLNLSDLLMLEKICLQIFNIFIHLFYLFLELTLLLFVLSIQCLYLVFHLLLQLSSQQFLLLLQLAPDLKIGLLLQLIVNLFLLLDFSIKFLLHFL